MLRRLAIVSAIATMAFGTVLSLPASATVPNSSTSNVGPDNTICDSGWRAVITDNRQNYLSPKFRGAIANHTGSTITGHFTTDTSGTYTFTVGASVSASAKAAIFAEVRAEVNGSVAYTRSTTIGVSVDSPIRPYSTLYGDYGLMVEYTYGYSYYEQSNCTKQQVVYATNRAPYRNAWSIYY